MATHAVVPLWSSTNEPRQFPCIALHGDKVCGSTPASLWQRTCRNGHSDPVRLCGQHAALAALGTCICRECEIKGFKTPITIEPILLLLAK